MAKKKAANKKAAKKKAGKKAAKKTGKKVGKRPAKKSAAKKAAGKAASGASMREKRSDFNKPVSVAIDRMPEPQRSIARLLDVLIRELVPGTTSAVKWGNACYYKDGLGFAVLAATRAGVNLALPGAFLQDPEGLLEGTGKYMRHVKVRDEKIARSKGVAALIKASPKHGFQGM